MEPDDRDSPWKEALDRYLEPFMRLLFPAAHAQVDWSRGWEPLNTELQQVVRDAEVGRRFADRLYRVWQLGGAEAWLLAHVEVQGQVDPELPQRIYVYRYRIYDRYRRPIASLVVLADDDPSWRPERYADECLGSDLTLNFATAKLFDWTGREAALQADPNPFALVVLAHLASLATRKDPVGRLDSKWTLTRALYGRGYQREDILELFRFLDWLLALPQPLARVFGERLAGLEEEVSTMPYVTSIERMAREDGRAEGRAEARAETLQDAVLSVVESRFGAAAAEALRERVRQVQAPEALDALLRRAAVVADLSQLFG